MPSMDFKDYYQVLGVKRDATPDEIRKAYRRAARKFHPDVSKEADASARMAEINEANAVLSDPERRSTYDAFGTRHGAADGFQPPPPRDGPAGATRGRSRRASGSAPGSGSSETFRGGFGSGPYGPGDEDYSDFFSSLFGHGARHAGADPRGFGGGEAPAFRGTDQQARVEISVAEAYRGATRRISLQTRPRAGQGAGDPSGAGDASSVRTLDVRIPKGVREGQLVRLTGQGGPGFNGGSPGDLYLEIHFQENPRLQVVGRDVYQKLPVSPPEAALGALVEAPTVAGRLEIRIPAGSQTGRRLRLRGKGLPAAEPGDLYLELEVLLPPADTDAARALYERMAREMPFDPRKGMDAEGGDPGTAGATTGGAS